MDKYQKELSSNGLKPKIVKMEGEALNNQDISFTGGIHFRLGRDKENHDFNEAMNGMGIYADTYK